MGPFKTIWLQDNYVGTSVLHTTESLFIAQFW